MAKYVTIEEVTSAEVARNLWIGEFYSDDPDVYNKVYELLAEAGDLTYKDNGDIREINVPEDSPLIKAFWIRRERTTMALLDI